MNYNGKENGKDWIPVKTKETVDDKNGLVEQTAMIWSLIDIFTGNANVPRVLHVSLFRNDSVKLIHLKQPGRSKGWQKDFQTYLTQVDLQCRLENKIVGEMQSLSSLRAPILKRRVLGFFEYSGNLRTEKDVWRKYEVMSGRSENETFRHNAKSCNILNLYT